MAQQKIRTKDNIPKRKTRHHITSTHRHLSPTRTNQGLPI